MHRLEARASPRPRSRPRRHVANRPRRSAVPPRLGALAERARRGRRRTRVDRRRAGRSTRRARRTRSAGRAGPSMPGIASGRNDGTAGTQFVTARPCSARSARFAVVVRRQLELPDPDRVEAGRGVGGDVLGERGVHGRDLREREPHDRPGQLCEKHASRASGGFVSSFADEIAGAGAEPRAGMRARADVPEARRPRVA